MTFLNFTQVMLYLVSKTCEYKLWKFSNSLSVFYMILSKLN